MKAFYLLFFFLLPLYVFGQQEDTITSPIEQIKRYEFIVRKKQGHDYSVYQLGKQGLLTLLQSKAFVKGNKKNLIFTKMTTDFNVVWQKVIPIKNGFELVDFSQENQFYYFLFHKNSFDYQVLRLDLQSGNSVFIPYERIVSLKVSHFKVLNHVLFLGGQVDNKPVVVYYNYQSNDMKLLPSTPSEPHIYLDRMDVDSLSNRMMLVFNGRRVRDKRTYIHHYNQQGKLVQRYILENNIDYSLESFRPYPLDDNSTLLIGTYSLYKRAKTQGIYSIVLGREEPKPRFYDFVYLKNFFNYMSPEKRKRYVKRAREKKRMGKTKHFSYDFFVNELRLIDDKLYLSAESYVPIFNERNAHDLPYWANMGSPFFYSYNRWYRYRRPFYNQHSQRSKVPTSYKFNNAIICAFDKNGVLKWDNSFSFDNHETDIPTPAMAYQPNADSLAMLHLYDDEIYFKQVQKSELQESELKTDFKTQNQEEKITMRRDEQLLAWHDSYFLVHGYQEIRNKSADTGKRKVFYLSKVQLTVPKPKKDN